MEAAHIPWPSVSPFKVTRGQPSLWPAAWLTVAFQPPCGFFFMSLVIDRTCVQLVFRWFSGWLSYNLVVILMQSWEKASAVLTFRCYHFLWVVLDKDNTFEITLAHPFFFFFPHPMSNHSNIGSTFKILMWPLLIPSTPDPVAPVTLTGLPATTPPRAARGCFQNKIQVTSFPAPLSDPLLAYWALYWFLQARHTPSPEPLLLLFLLYRPLHGLHHDKYGCWLKVTYSERPSLPQSDIAPHMPALLICFIYILST